ncbi:DUF2062 domain-containing protein [Synechococcus sp. 1G10]|uniref:DUF2062 domain-containing protein n=1 Tax=Synechococcus sp. 1G10 TaxID=2025605 RepID=UPI001E3696A5|nr:DUF2062 domain-containing protein [Synechococcus sp. 1G10]
MSSGFLARIHLCIHWLWMQEGSHGQRARGLADGVSCGCFPCFGLQTLLGVGPLGAGLVVLGPAAAGFDDRGHGGVTGAGWSASTAET